MAIKKVPTSVAPWPPATTRKRAYTVVRGDSFETIASREKINVWTLIYFNFQTRNPAEVNWYLERHLHCTQQTVDGKNFVFKGGETIYLPVVPETTCDGSAFRSGWNASEIANYRQWVRQNGEWYVGRKNYKRDCADFAMDLLVDFATTKRMPVALNSGPNRWLKMDWAEGTLCVPEGGEVFLRQDDLKFGAPGSPDYQKFAQSARRWVVAEELDNVMYKNTIPITLAQLQPGDLLTLGPPSTAHVQVVLSSNSKITVGGKPRRVLEIAQGNTAEGWVMRGTSPGRQIAHRAWDLDDHTMYYEKVDGHWREAKDWEGNISHFHYRRWDFENFNRIYDLPSTP